MKLRLILFILFIFNTLSTFATHIVGGELGLSHVQDNIYDLNMTLYFDAINGNPEALDETVILHIFRKRDDGFIRSYELPIVTRELVDYTNPDCGIGELVTRKIFYTRRIILDPATYSDSEGYYVIWERCCRNNIISNIIDPGGAGQTFYMEFPPLIRNGRRFFNSTPELFPPLSDYACVNQPFYFDFSGEDADGDSLVYYLSVPINGNSSRSVPAPDEPFSAPYSHVIWENGYGLNTMINGNPPLNIDNTGIVRVTPSETGLFVFAVTCDEYRNGVKIGSVVRDFQMLVIDCRISSPPIATPILPDGSGEYNQTDTIDFRVGDANKCFNIEVRDRDTGPITGRVVPIEGFEPGFLTRSSGFIQGANDVVELQACFPPCPTDPIEPTVYGMNVIVEDNNCAVPLQDTVRLFVRIIPEENIPPEVTSSLGEFSEENQEYTITIQEGNLLDFNIFGDDTEGDTLLLSMNGIDFDPASLGMTFGGLRGLPVLTDNFSWQVPCDLLENDQDSAEYLLQFVASDEKICGLTKQDTTFVRIIVQNDDQINTVPEVLANLAYDSLQQMYIDTVIAGDKFNFQVIADDLDLDTLNLNILPDGFSLADFGINFPANIRSTPLITADFSWQTDCDMLDQPETEKLFDFQFIVEDERLCNKSKSDTIKVRILLQPRLDPNEPPVVSTDLELVKNMPRIYSDTIYFREDIRSTITADDIDLDSLILEGYGIDFNFADLGIEFTTVTGIAPIQTELYWKPTCDALNVLGGETVKTYEMIFRSTDFNDCLFDTKDSVQVNLTVIFEPVPNENPLLSSDLTQVDTGRYFTETTAEDDLSFLIIADDENQDSIRVSVFGDGFDLEELGINFRDTAGFAPMQLPFEWQTSCAYLNGSPDPVDFEVFYVVEDFKNCGLSQKDTIHTTIRVNPLPNPNPPVLDISNLNFDAQQNIYTWDMVPGQELKFVVTGTDEDGDELELYAEGVGFNLADFQMNFENQRGIAPVSEEFSWLSTCDIFAERQEFEIRFFLRDYTKCQLDEFDTATVRISLTDLVRSDDFTPPNVFTPNNDGKNDTFYISNLPVDNCQDEFRRIEIYNRWGRKVFESDQRDFEWTGKNFPNGVYFYEIFFKNSVFKGTVTILGSSVN